MRPALGALAAAAGVAALALALASGPGPAAARGEPSPASAPAAASAAAGAEAEADEGGEAEADEGDAAPAQAPLAAPIPDAPAVDPLTELGVRATAGVAPGYLPDEVCATCHADRAETYRKVGMARSLARPRRAAASEDFAAATFEHAPSRQRFALRWQGERLVFRRDQLDREGRPINAFEQPVDWILGSGNHSRVYLYGTPGGELYQLPIAWYSQERGWGMAPGYDRPDHDGVTRRVRRECMFCHNAYPEAAVGSDTYEAPQAFPADLPEGTGCQRCHGPGAEHVRRALAMTDDPEPARAAIVHPGRLPAARREEICYGCHLQPAVALPAALRFGRGDYSLRPGEPLADYRVALDARFVGEADPGERFEINHHPYRLRQSRCFVASGGALSCLTCHDPHRRVPPAERAKHYRAACLGCHGGDDCTLPPDAVIHSPDAATGAPGAAANVAMPPDPGPQADAARTAPGARGSAAEDGTPHEPLTAAGTGLAAAATPASGPSATAERSDCVACHMPPRRTEDVVHVVMTDHRIGRPAVDRDLTAPRAEVQPQIETASLLPFAGAPTGALARIYGGVALIRAGAPESGLELLEPALAAEPQVATEPYFDLAKAQLLTRRFAAARETLHALLARRPGSALAHEWLAIAHAGVHDRAAAITELRLSLALDADRAEALFNLGHLLFGAGEAAAAVPPLERALALRPNLVAAAFYRALAAEALQQPAEAERWALRTLALEPRHTQAYLLVARRLAARGERAEALRYLRHGAEVAARPADVAAALAAALTEAGGDDTGARP